MAEIKSTLDLVMERTKHLVQTKEEKDAEKIKEREGKSNGLVLALREERLRPEELKNAVSEADPEDPEAMSQALLKVIIDALGLKPEPILIKALNILDARQVISEHILEVESLTLAYEKMTARLAEASEQGILKELADIGISGSALAAKTGENNNQEKALADVDQDMAPRLEFLKKGMRDRLSRS